MVCPRDDLTDLPARGARLTRRDEGAYWQYSTEEQRRQVGCPAREVSRHFGDTPLAHGGDTDVAPPCPQGCGMGRWRPALGLQLPSRGWFVTMD